MKKTILQSTPASLVFVYLACILVEGFIFGSYLWKPNDFVFAFGGDALVIYYDMIYQVCHGGGIHFDGMNYPYGESLFMTDANASFTILLSWINNWFPVCEMVPGILHSLILFLLPFTAIFLFLILSRLGVTKTSSFIFSILITFLCPQMLRVLSHFGLAFPFVIPMAIYWVLTKFDKPKWRISDIVYVAVLLFFFLNNPYLGFAATALVMISGIIIFLKNKKTGLSVFILGLIPTIIGYLMISLTDPFDDRIAMQWGFFYYYASIPGLLIPDGSLLSEGISYLTEAPKIRFEGRINLGIATVFTIFATAIILIKNKLTNKPTPGFKVPLPFRPLIWASAILFIYAANYSLYGFAKPFLEEYLGKLLMFKASGRMAWPLYFILSIYTVLVLDKILPQKKTPLIFIYILAVLFWGIEAYRFNSDRFQNVHHSNPFKEKQFAEQVKELDLSQDDYQAIYMLPVTQSWSDKFLYPVHFQTQYSGMILSAKTGIPMINAMLSRAPLTTSITSIQLSSDPYIHKERIKDMDLDKPVLLVLGDKHPALSRGESYLLEKSVFLGTFAKAKIYSLDLKDIRTSVIPEPSKTVLIAEDFEPDGNTHFGIDDNFCKQTTPENNLIWKGRFSSTLEADSLDIILWYYLQANSYHNPEISIECDDRFYSFYNRNSKNFKGNWVQQSISIPYGQELTIWAQGQKTFVFDSLTISYY